MPQYEAVLPIACVEGWSASAHWRGVRVRDLLDRAGARVGAGARVDSLEKQGLYASSLLSPQLAAHPDTLLALELNGAPLDLDHGYPVRLIAPDRPGVLQTKWVSTVETL
jgi:DMSO/TMAO reductase YedYZ molybdopterin-dependent catalytic subunit